MVTDPEGIWMECRRDEDYLTAEASTSSRRLFPPYFGSGLGTSSRYPGPPLPKGSAEGVREFEMLIPLWGTATSDHGHPAKYL